MAGEGVGHSFGAEVVFLYAQAHPDQVAGFVLFPQGENDEGIDTTSNESMLTDPLPADMPYVVMFDEECEGLPPPLQNQKDRNRMLTLLELTAKDLAKVGKGDRYVRVKNAGHDIPVTDPEAVLATVDRVWKAALGR